MLNLIIRANRYSLIAMAIVIPLLLFHWQGSVELTPLSKFTANSTDKKLKSPYNSCDLTNVNKALILKEPTLPINLPDLRSEIVFCGKNDRPDANTAQNLAFLSIGGQEPQLLKTQTPLYLEKKQTTGRFGLSETASPLWIEIQPFNSSEKNQELNIHSVMHAFDKEKTQDFVIKEQLQASLSSGTPPEIGKMRMDTSLFARQRARWIGEDLFFYQHGGNEYSSFNHKQRIEFGEGDNTYACFVTEGDCLIFENDRWKEANPSEKTRSFFMAQAKKIEDRLMHFTVWSPDGKHRVMLTLVKPAEPPLNTRMTEEFKYIGAKSKRQWIFELKGKRIALKLNDWWLYNEKNWIKLSTPQQIDQYVAKKLNGFLFVFDGIVKKQGQLVLKGHIFNANRTQVAIVEQILQGQHIPPIVKSEKPNLVQAQPINNSEQLGERSENSALPTEKEPEKLPANKMRTNPRGSPNKQTSEKTRT